MRWFRSFNVLSTLLTSGVVLAQTTAATITR